MNESVLQDVRRKDPAELKREQMGGIIPKGMRIINKA